MASSEARRLLWLAPGLSAQELASRSGIDIERLEAIERDAAVLWFDEAMAIAEALAIDLEELAARVAEHAEGE